MGNLSSSPVSPGADGLNEDYAITRAERWVLAKRCVALLQVRGRTCCFGKLKECLARARVHKSLVLFHMKETSVAGSFAAPQAMCKAPCAPPPAFASDCNAPCQHIQHLIVSQAIALASKDGDWWREICEINHENPAWLRRETKI